MDFVSGSQPSEYSPIKRSARPTSRSSKAFFSFLQDSAGSLAPTPAASWLPEHWASAKAEVMASVALASGLEMDAAHLLLNLVSVSAHLTYLSDLGRAEPFVKDGSLLWRKKNGSPQGSAD